MANLYVRSTDGSDADNGSTWALAKATVAGAAAIDAAGDTTFVSQAHAETTAAGVTWAMAGTLASPSYIVCGNDAAEPPTAVATSATITTTGTSNFVLTAVGGYVCGIAWSVGSGAGTVSWVYNSEGRLTLENCTINIVASGASGSVAVGNNTASRSAAHFKNVNMTFAATTQGVQVSGGSLVWDGGSITSGSAITTLFKSAAGNTRGMALRASGLNLSGCATALVLFAVGGTSPWDAVIRDSRLPASWSGTLVSGTFSNGQRMEMHNCSAGSQNYRMWVEDYSGSIRDETTIVRSGGASDGVTPIAWKMVTSANASYPLMPLASPEIVIANDTVGSSMTLTAEIVHDSQGAGTAGAFLDSEVWIELMYLGTSGYPIASFVVDCKADILATAADQASSSVTWTTTGLTTPIKQKLVATFTPQLKGFLHARVMLAKASKTCYVCPKVAVA